MKKSPDNARRIIRAEQFELMSTYLNYRHLINKRSEGILGVEHEELKEKATAEASANELIDDVHFEEVRDEYKSTTQRQRLDGYGFTTMDPEKEVNNFSYRVVSTSSGSLNRAGNRYYTPLEVRYGNAYTRHNARPAKGHWHDSQVR